MQLLLIWKKGDIRLHLPKAFRLAHRVIFIATNVFMFFFKNPYICVILMCLMLILLCYSCKLRRLQSKTKVGFCSSLCKANTLNISSKLTLPSHIPSLGCRSYYQCAKISQLNFRNQPLFELVSFIIILPTIPTFVIQYFSNDELKEGLKWNQLFSRRLSKLCGTKNVTLLTHASKEAIKVTKCMPPEDQSCKLLINCTRVQ